MTDARDDLNKRRMILAGEHRGTDVLLGARMDRVMQATLILRYEITLRAKMDSDDADR